MRRLRPYALLCALAFVALFVSPAVANAQAARAAAPSCPGSSTYPPSPNATVQSSTTTPNAGDTITVSGTNYCPNENVSITINGQNVGSAHTNGAGAFGGTSVVVPGPAGSKPLCGIGASGLSNDRDCLTLYVGAAGGTSTSNNGGGTGGTSGGGTAFTGVQIALLATLAAVLIVGGAGFTIAGRRRRSNAPSH